MEEKPFRVLLDFTELNLNSSYLKYVWINVSPRKLRTIKDLKNAILNKYPVIQENVKLFLLDGLLPENERIFILRENDTVRLQVDSSNQSLQEFIPSCNDLESTNHKDYLEETLSRNSKKLKGSKKRKNDTNLTSYHDNSTENRLKRKKSSTRISKFFEPVLIDISSPVVVEDKQTLAQLTSQNILEAREDQSELSHYSENSSKKKKNGKSSTISDAHEPDSVHISSSACFEGELNNIPHTSRNSEVARESECNVPSIVQNKKKKNSKNSLSRMSTCDFLTYAATLSGLENNNESTSKSNFNVSANESISCAGSNDRSSKITMDESVNGQNAEATTKRKRKRKRKRKPEPCLTDSIQRSLDAVSFETSIGSTNKDYSSDTRKHVLYRSPTPPIMSESVILSSNPDSIHVKSSLEEEENNIVDNLNSTSLEIKLSQNTYSNIETYSPVSSLTETAVPSEVSTPYSGIMLKTKPWEITPMPKTSYTDSNTFSVKECDNFEKEGKIKPVYDLCPSLNSVPPVGTRLAYKTLELSESYCPEVTDFKEGILKSIDPTTDELEIELIKEEIKPGRKGKFELLKEDEIPPIQVIKKIHLKWKDLIDPRLVN